MSAPETLVMAGGQASGGDLSFAREIQCGGAVLSVTWDGVVGWRPERDGDLLWVHLDHAGREVAAWLQNELGVSAATLEAVTSSRNRPRAFRDGDALAAVLRSLDSESATDPSALGGIQIWADASHIVTLCRGQATATADLLAKLDTSRLGAVTVGGLLTRLVERAVFHIGRVVSEMNEDFDRLEEGRSSLPLEEVLDSIADTRRRCLALKRHMSPQYDALLDMRRLAPPWLSQDDRDAIRETIDQLQHYLDEIDVTKESAVVLQDDIASRAAAQTQKTSYLLSIVAAIFLPISFLTSMLGMDVGGTPGVGAHSAFWIVCGLMAALVAVQLVVFRRLRWI